MIKDPSRLLLRNATVITMDPERRVLAGTSIAIDKGRIIALGDAADREASGTDTHVIDCTRKAVLPGLVDLHGYLAGAIMKPIIEGIAESDRRHFLERMISRATDAAWWEVEAQLCALERLKFGTTCMFSMMGGNGTRTDDPEFARIAAREVARIGLRARIGLGPARPPWPRTFTSWKNGKAVDGDVSFDTVIDNCDRLLSERALQPDGIVDFCTALSRIGNRNAHDPVWSPEREVWIGRQAEAMRHLMTKHKVGFWTHAYGNSVEYAHDERLGLLGPTTILSHCTDIPPRAVSIMAETGTSAAHHPRVSRALLYRCPVTEMLEAGVAVGLGADAPGGRNCDIFLDMKAVMMVQRTQLRNNRAIPAGKALEMATIDAYRALGLADELGSVEIGKKADLITIDLFQPHLRPYDDMVLQRIVYSATGGDVRDAIVDGRLVMADRRVQTIDEADLLDRAQQQYHLVAERLGEKPSFHRHPERIWGRAFDGTP